MAWERATYSLSLNLAHRVPTRSTAVQRQLVAASKFGSSVAELVNFTSTLSHLGDPRPL